MTASQAIEIINRRAVSLQKLFGQNSEYTQKFLTGLTPYDVYTDKNGNLKMRNISENRKAYRQLTAFAKRIQNKPIQVEMRKADRINKAINEELKREQWQNERTKIVDIETYNKWLNTFNDYYNSCYELARLNGLSGYDAMEYADYLYGNESAYNEEWNKHYYNGEFDVYRAMYEEQQTFQEYEINPDTGDLTEVTDFYREL